MSKMSKKPENFDNIPKKLKKVKKLRQHRYYLGKLKEKRHKIMTKKVLISVRAGQKKSKKHVFNKIMCLFESQTWNISKSFSATS